MVELKPVQSSPDMPTRVCTIGVRVGCAVGRDDGGADHGMHGSESSSCVELKLGHNASSPSAGCASANNHANELFDEHARGAPL